MRGEVDPSSDVPKIENIHQRVLAEITANPASFDMSSWHGRNDCGTTHCRAGMIVHLAGDAGRALEAYHNTQLAAQLIYKASSPIRVSPPRFYESNEVALADMVKCAAEEAALRAGASVPPSPEDV